MLLLTQDEYNFIKESNEIEGEVGVDFDHLEAFIAVKRFNNFEPIRENHVLGWHGLLMQNKLKRFAGQYRQTDVGIYKGHELIKAMPGPLFVKLMMEDWVKDFNEMKLTPWELHKRFENIHPFIDGNGRAGRLLWAYDLLRRGQEVKPMLDSFHKESVYTDEYKEFLKSDKQSFSGNEYKEIYFNDFNSKRQRYYDAL